MDIQLLTKKVEKINCLGLEAYTDAYALYENEVMFMSMFGNKTAVRGLWASLVSGRWIDLFTKSEGQIYARSENKWRVHVKNLPSGITQAMLIPQQLRLKHVERDFVVIGTSKERIRKSFFLYLNKVSKVPLKEEWTDWLFVKTGRESMLTELRTLNIIGFYYQGSDEMLSEFVTAGIKKKAIS